MNTILEGEDWTGRQSKFLKKDNFNSSHSTIFFTIFAYLLSTVVVVSVLEFLELNMVITCVLLASVWTLLLDLSIPQTSNPKLNEEEICPSKNKQWDFYVFKTTSVVFGYLWAKGSDLFGGNWKQPPSEPEEKDRLDLGLRQSLRRTG